MSTIYLDNAATTKVRDEIVDTMSTVIKNEYGNPSSTHSYGRSSKSIVELSRKEISNILNVKSSEIIFTSGGTEGDNMIIRNCVKNLDVRHIITSKIEHHAVTHTIDDLLRTDKIKVSFVKLSKSGDVDLEDLENILKNSNQKSIETLNMLLSHKTCSINVVNALSNAGTTPLDAAIKYNNSFFYPFITIDFY